MSAAWPMAVGPAGSDGGRTPITKPSENTMPVPTDTLTPVPTRARPAVPGTRRIVVADDHPVFREGMVRALVQTGRYEIAGEAADGQTALDLILRHRPDVALVDLRMPGLDGLGLLRRVSAEELGVSLVLLSAFTQPKIVDEALAAGAAGYLSKDASREEILAAVDAAALGGRIVQHDAPGPAHDEATPARRADNDRARAQHRREAASHEALVSTWLRELARTGAASRSERGPGPGPSGRRQGSDT
jgi:DNA-binding NarL/FixJ family response regulator